MQNSSAENKAGDGCRVGTVSNHAVRERQKASSFVGVSGPKDAEATAYKAAFNGVA